MIHLMWEHFGESVYYLNSTELFFYIYNIGLYIFLLSTSIIDFCVKKMRKFLLTNFKICNLPLDSGISQIDSWYKISFKIVYLLRATLTYWQRVWLLTVICIQNRRVRRSFVGLYYFSSGQHWRNVGNSMLTSSIDRRQSSVSLWQ